MIKQYCPECKLYQETKDGWYYKKCVKCESKVKPIINNKIINLSVLCFIITIFCLIQVSALDVYTNISTSQNIGVIRSDFYGANVQTGVLASDMQTYGAWNGSLWLNATEYQNSWILSGMKTIRQDMRLQAYYYNTSASNGLNFSSSAGTNGTNFTINIETLKWAYKNGLNIIYIADYMPTWLADNSSGQCLDLNMCPPSNQDKWNNIVNDFINRSSEGNLTLQSIITVEVWNEPDVNTYWMGKLGNGNVSAALNYSVFYNSTYWSIKSNYSNMKVGIGAFGRPVSWQDFATNATYGNSYDFISFHDYRTTNFNATIYESLETSIGFIKSINSTVPIYITEWNTNNAALQNDTYPDRYRMQTASGYSYVLSHYPTDINMQFYKFWNSQAITSGTVNRWEMFSGSQLANKSYPPYNITKLFATSHKYPNTIKNSSTSRNDLKVVSSSDGQNYNITLTNTNSSSITTQINIPLSGKYLKDISTGQAYSLVNNQTPQFSLAGYEVKTLSSQDGIPLSITNTPSGDITISGHTASINITVDHQNSLDAYCINKTNTVNCYPKPILWYQFNNITGLENESYVHDFSENGNSAIAININWENDTSLARNGDGGFRFSENITASKPKYLTTEQIITNTSDNFSVSLWVNPSHYSYADDAYISRLIGNYGLLIRYDDNGGNQACYLSFYNGTADGDSTGYHTNTEYVKSDSNSCSRNKWHHLILTVNGGNNLSFYVDNVLYFRGQPHAGMNRPFAGALTNMTIGSAGNGYSSLSYLSFNGSIDNFMIFNSTLSETERLLIYNSQIEYYNSTRTEVYNEITSNGLSNTINFIINDSIGNSNSTKSQNIRTIQQIILNNQKIGNVRYDFYGTGLQGTSHMFSGTIDTNCDGIYETTRNYTWNKETFINGGNKMTYFDASFNTYYNGVENPSFEYWKNISARLNGSDSSSTREMAWGWKVSGSADANALISNSTDAHSGNYSMNISRDSEGNNDNFILFPNFGDSSSYGIGNGTYKISFWIKGNASFGLGIQNTSTVACNTSTFNTDWANGWNNYNLSCTFSGLNTLYNFYINSIGRNETLLIDDFILYKDNQQINWWNKGSTIAFENQLIWDKDNNITDMIIMDYTPRFLVARQPNCIDALNDTNTGDCMPYNISIIAEISLDFYKRVDQGRNRTYVQIWNEPYGSFFEDNLPSFEPKTDFVLLFNQTYKTIKGYNNSIKIIGYRDTSMTYFGSRISNFTKMMMSNLSDEFSDGFSFHPYAQDYINYYSYTIADSVRDIFSNLSYYGANTSYLTLDEWQPTNNDKKNSSNGQSSWYRANVALAYTQILNTYPNNVSMMYYHWGDPVSYFNCNSKYSEYPSFWSGVSEAGLDNSEATYYPTYNITKDFSKYCPSGWSTINSSNDYLSGIAQVYCVSQDEKNKALININKENDLQNISTILPSGTWIKVNDGTIYTSNGISETNLGVMNNYSVDVYTTPNLTLNVSGLSKENYLGEQIGTLSSELEITNDRTNDYTRTLTIVSTITTTTDIIVTADCSKLSGTQSFTFTCNDTTNELTIRDYSINEGTNYITISYILGCDSNYLAGSNIIILLTALAIVSVVFFFVFKDGMGNVTVGGIIMLAIVIIVSITLFVGSTQNLGGYCS